jgi:hypothetical protein
MSWIGDIVVSVSLLLLSLKALDLELSASSLVLACVAAALIGLRVVGRVAGGPVSHVVRLAFTIGLPVLSGLFFVSTYSGSPSFVAAGVLVGLFAFAAGLYVVLFGAYSSELGIIWNLPALASLAVFALSLGVSARVSPLAVLLYIAVLISVRAMGQRSGYGRATRIAYSIFLPVAAAATYVLFTYASSGKLSLEPLGGAAVVAGIVVIAILGLRAVRR